MLLLIFSNQGGLPPPPKPPQATPGYSWERTRHYLEQRERKLREALEKKAQNEARIAAKEAEIARLEAKRAKDLANQAMQIELRDMLKQLAAFEQEQKRLVAILEFYKREEDDMICLLYSLPFMA